MKKTHEGEDLKMYNYYISASTDEGFIGFSVLIGFQLNSTENIKKMVNWLEIKGKRNPVILFFKLLN